jgi:predicted phage-related endonuclease
MSRARQAGIGESDAAIAFGCNPSTMREHYLALDETAIADEVFSRLGAKS